MDGYNWPGRGGVRETERGPGSHLGGGNEGGVIQEAGFGKRTLIGAQGFYGNNRHTTRATWS